jgi:hypothetical protein
VRGGPTLWTFAATALCNQSYRLYCFGTQFSTALGVNTPSGRLTFVSQGTFTPGGGLAAADTLCANEASSAGLAGTYRAFPATATATAASRFSPAGADYVRIDGQPVASASTLFAGGNLAGGVWQQASGTYINTSAWTGATTPGAIGAGATTCASWTSTAGTATTGLSGVADSGFWNFAALSCSSTGIHVYCLQQ